MSERKFTKSLGKPGTAAQLRETVSQVVRETTVQNKPQLVDPIDFESFVLKNKTLLQNDPQRELLLYPPDDVSQVVLPRRFRTSIQTVPAKADADKCSLFTRQCIATYSANWNLIHYKYNTYSGSYRQLPKLANQQQWSEQNYEIDIDVDKNAVDKGGGGDAPGSNSAINTESHSSNDGMSKEGYLMKGPETGSGSDRMFAHIGSKSFKRRYCSLRQEVDGTYILDLFKDERKGEAKATIVMDFCTEVVRNTKRGRFCFELRMIAGHKSYTLAAENENDLHDWLTKLTLVLQQNKIQEEKRAASLERASNSPPPSPQSYQCFGTLKGLEQSMNPQLMKYARETDGSISVARRENRTKLFPLYAQMVQNPKSPTTSHHNSIEETETAVVEPYKEQFGHRILIKCETIKFRLQAPLTQGDKEVLCQVEPYFSTLALFDVRNNRKLTENFCFDVNHPAVRGMIKHFTYNGDGDKDADNDADTNNEEMSKTLGNVPHEWLLYPRQALLNVTNPHPDIFVVVRLEKILQGGICQSAEPYIRSTTKDPRLGLKVQKGVGACCQRLGNYRMPFAWAAKPLFRLYSNELDTSPEFPAVYRQEGCRMTDEELLKLLAEYRKPEKFSKLTLIPGWIKLNIQMVTDLPENCLTTSLVPLKPFPIPPTQDSPIIEVMEFEGNSERDVHPYTTFINNLYVYPLSLNFDTQKMFTRARNIACVVELKDSDHEHAKPLQCIYGRPGNKMFVRRMCCCVLHHNTNPFWYDEVKIRLPAYLHQAHHLLFTFYHISCNLSKKQRENGVEHCVGFAWVPLCNKGKLNVDVQAIPVAAQLPSGYLSIQPLGLGQGNAGPEVQWIDSQKSIFTVGFHLVSTVHTRDQHLHNLFAHTERLLDTKPVALPAESETCKILKALHAIQLNTLITFLPTLLNQLFMLLVATTSTEIALNVIRVLINLVNMICEAGRTEILHTYVKFVFVSPAVSTGSGCNRQMTVHEEFSKHLPNILHPNNTDFLVVNKFMHHSNFFFDIMVKSMAQYLLSTGRIKMHRNERFTSDYLQKIESLCNVLITYLIQKHKEMPVETHELNKSLAKFLKKCLSFMDRGILFKLINSYMDKFNPGDSRILQEFKFTFLEIICSHEHYVSLNLPLKHSRLSPKSRCLSAPVVSSDFVQEYCLSAEFCRNHFLVALLLQEMRTALNEMVHIRRMALTTLRDLLAKHELDDRYQHKGQMNRIAAIYMPWLAVVLENFNRLQIEEEQQQAPHSAANANCANAGGQRFSASSSSFLFANVNAAGTSSTSSFSVVNETPNKASRRFTLHLDQQHQQSPVHLRNSAFFDAIAGQAIMNGSSSISLESDNVSTISDDVHSSISQETTIIRDDNHRNAHTRTVSSHIQRYDKFQTSEMKDILVCFLFIVKYVGDEHIVTWWQHASDSELLTFFAVLDMCLCAFRYVGRRNVVVGGSKMPAAATDLKLKPAKAHTLPARMNPAEFTYDANTAAVATATLVIHTTNRENLVDSQNESAKLHQALIEGNMTTEVGLIVLDCIGSYCMHFRENLTTNDGDNPMMAKIFDIYLTFIQIGQSETLFKHIFAALRAFINNFSFVLFKGNAVLCGRLCYELLRCCNSRIASIRQESCAILYLLMRSNFEFTNRKGLTRVHLQVIISVSQMLGNVIGLNNSRFQESLSLINSFASSDKVMKGTGFPVEVKDLTKRIRTVLMATLQMREHHHDPEMLVELQHSLANSYASTPELRHTWLETMTRNHVRDGNFSEAACCQLHIAALMAEYLKLKQVHGWGADAFSKISLNIVRDERSLKLDAGVQDVQYSEYSLLEQLETCVEYVRKAERYELLSELYKLITPIYERKRSYEHLAQCYHSLSQAYTKVVEVQRSGKRLLGRYYRVAFFGQAYFEEDHGLDYVYKEPKVTSLSEITERLFRQYSDKFRSDVVKMVQDSAPIEIDELDPKIAYIQITHVTPYFEKGEFEERQTEFEQSHDISHFMYETPFTKDGNRARGSPEEQWKRRTILTTQYAFPYVKKRISVQERRVVELGPIEVAIDEMQTRVAELEDVVFREPTDVKRLQLRLQGSVCVQVNAGPLAYATVFLEPTLAGMYPDEKVEELKDVFRDFLKICYTALQINSKLITADQHEYQEVLRQNYKKLCNSLSTLFGESLWPHEDTGSFQRNSMALFSAISGASHNSSTA